MPRLSRQRITGQLSPDQLNVVSWLGTDQRGAAVLTTARRLLAVERAIAKVLPPAMAQVCRVANVDGQQITLAVPSAAYASKLRQLAPRIEKILTENGWNLTEIRFKVQARLLQIRTKTAPVREVAPLDRKALLAFAELRRALDNGPLAEAVTRLLKHHHAG
jgi:hypothetical protein